MILRSRPARPIGAVRRGAHPDRIHLATSSRDLERGTFTIAVVLWMMVTLALAAFVVDGGLSISERERAGDIAQQAARAAANDLITADLRSGQYAIDFSGGPGGACAQAQDVLTADGLAATDLVSCAQSSTMTVAGPPGTPAPGITVPVVEIEVTIPYRPIFTGMFYSSSVNVSASATAYPDPGI